MEVRKINVLFAILMFSGMIYAQNPMREVSKEEKEKQLLKEAETQKFSDENSAKFAPVKFDEIIGDESSTGTRNSKSLSIPYSMGFEDDEDWQSWVIVNDNCPGGTADGSNWKRYQSATYAHGGEYCMRSYLHVTCVNNDWFFSPLLPLEAGKGYIVKFWLRAQIVGGYNEKVAVYLTNGQTVESVIGSPIWFKEEIQCDYTEFEAIAPISTSGNYGFAFQRYSGAMQFGVCIDDISIEETTLESNLVAVSITGSDTPYINVPTDYTVTVYNEGYAQSNYTVKLMGEGDVELSSVPGVAIASGETKEFVLTWTHTVAGVTYVYGKVELASDVYQEDNVTTHYNVEVLGEGISLITIGNGTEVFPVPVSLNYERSLGQTIYTAEEIGTGCIINKLRYRYTVHSYETMIDLPITIWMGETDKSIFSGNPVGDQWVDPAGLQKVYEGSHSFPPGEAYVEFDLNTPFVYTALNNLVIYTHRGTAGTGIWMDGFFGENSTGRSIRRCTSDDTIDPMNPGAEKPSIWTIMQIIDGYPNISFYVSTILGGALEGIVKDENDNPMEGVSVKLIDHSLKTTTDEFGYYSFPYLPVGEFDVEFSFYGYITQTISVTIQEGITEIKDIQLLAIPKFTVSGIVTGNDAPQGLEDVKITLTGFENYGPIYTDATGYYEFEDGVYSGFTYELIAVKEGYVKYIEQVTVNGENVINHDFMLTEKLYPVRNVTAEKKIPTNIDVTVVWEEAIQIDEFRYDSGINDGQIGFQTGGTNPASYPNHAIGSAHKVSATLNKMMWYFTNNRPQPSLTVLVFGLNNDGTPDRNNIIFTANDVPNTPLQWCEYEFPESVVAPNGFFMALRSTDGQFLSLGCDSPNTEYPFQPQTHFYCSDVTQYNFAPFEQSSIMKNAMVRAEGIVNGKSVSFGYNISDESKTNSKVGENLVMIPSETAVVTQEPVTTKNVSRGLTGYNVYRLLEGESESEWNLLTETPLPTTQLSYVQTGALNTIDAGVYQNAVKAVYSGGFESVARLSNKWDVKKFALTYDTPTNGVLSVMEGTTPVPSGTMIYDGTVLKITATANIGYHLETLTVNGNTHISGENYTVTSETKIVAKFAINKYAVTYETPTNGTLSVLNGTTPVPSGTIVDHGVVLKITVEPNAGYHLETFTVNGDDFESGDNYTVASETIIAAKFAINKYTVTYATPENGTLSVMNGATPVPSGTMVDHGTVLKITAEPNSGYHLETLTVNGTNHTNGANQTVTSAITIVTKFAINPPDTYTVIYDTPQNGILVVKAGTTIIISGSAVENGTILTITATPNDNYHLVTLTVNGNNFENEGNYSVTSTTIIAATFAIYTYIITVNSNNTDWGSVTGSDTYEHGATVILTAFATANYKFLEWTEGGTKVSDENPYIFTANADRTIVGNFDKDEGIKGNILSNVVLYPNPFKNEINISNPEVVKSIEITNATGQKVKSVTFNGKTISTGELASGVYFVIIESVAGEKVVHKMVKK